MIDNRLKVEDIIKKIRDELPDFDISIFWFDK